VKASYFFFDLLIIIFLSVYVHADYAIELVRMRISFHVYMLVAIWGAGLSFSKCHAERKVKVDPHTPNIFDGEEFSKAVRYWTYGYDIYSPHRVYVLHDYNISQVLIIESTYRFNVDHSCRTATSSPCRQTRCTSVGR
jgi:hypothetical protein